MKHLNKTVFAKAIIDEHFRDRWTKTWNLNPSSFEAMSPETVRFLTRTVGGSEPMEVLREFRKSYFKFLKRMFGANIGRKQNWQPLMYAFVDFDGSRYGYSGQMRLPHVHAIMLTHPDHCSKIDNLAMNDTVFLGSEKFDPRKGNLTGLAAYCMKGVVTNGGIPADRGLLWDVFPA
jgi:hypothetical protein